MFAAAALLIAVAGLTAGCAGAKRAGRSQVPAVKSSYAQLVAKNYKYYRPGLQDQEWGTREMTVQDGFGNKLIFYRPLS